MDVAYLTPADLACSAELQKSGTFSGSVKACRQAVKGIRALTGSGGGRMFSSASLRLTSYASSSSGNEKKQQKCVTFICSILRTEGAAKAAKANVFVVSVALQSFN